jgi:diguanylate cyclase (GGDEF)-like protein
VREGDAVGRYGGEEFIVIFPHTEMDDAHEVAERIREAVASMQWNEYGFNNLPRITISAGLACFPQHGYSHYHLTNAADKALYRAKRDGKNRIVIHSELKERVEDGQ